MSLVRVQLPEPKFPQISAVFLYFYRGNLFRYKMQKSVKNRKQLYQSYTRPIEKTPIKMIAKPVFTNLSEDYTPLRTTERSPYICRIQNVYIFNYQNFKK